QPQLQGLLHPQRPADRGVQSDRRRPEALHRSAAAVPPVLLPGLRPGDRERDRGLRRPRVEGCRTALEVMSFAAVTSDEGMRRARDIVPTLRERAQKCEDARGLLPENEKLLHETGLFRFHQPKRFGGMELPFVAVVDIVSELARGCPSTAWNVGNLGCHHWILGYYDQKAQHELWDANPDVLIASSIALAAGRGRKAPG